MLRTNCLLLHIFQTTWNQNFYPYFQYFRLISVITIIWSIGASVMGEGGVTILCTIVPNMIRNKHFYRWHKYFLKIIFLLFNLQVITIFYIKIKCKKNKYVESGIHTSCFVRSDSHWNVIFRFLCMFYFFNASMGHQIFEKLFWINLTLCWWQIVSDFIFFKLHKFKKKISNFNIFV